jgi:TolA-binding protein
MSSTDLHPEALLEKEASGTLGESERAQLDRHLERCETCRFERRVRGDFAEELAESGRLPERVRFAELLAETRVLAQGTGRAARARVRATWFLAAAVVCGSGAAMGAGLGRHVLSRVEDSTLIPVSAPKAPQAERLQQEVPARVAATATPSDKHPKRESEEAPLSLPEVQARITPPIRSAPGAPWSADTPASPASLFDAESTARRQGDYDQAMSFHRELEARFGLSTEAQVSRAIMGRGLLDRGRAADALACFDHYLASGSGELGEEVMAARATALERLERADDARAAWQRLRETYPTTTYASRVTTHVESSTAL